MGCDRRTNDGMSKRRKSRVKWNNKTENSYSKRQQRTHASVSCDRCIAINVSCSIRIGFHVPNRQRQRQQRTADRKMLHEHILCVKILLKKNTKLIILNRQQRPTKRTMKKLPCKRGFQPFSSRRFCVTKFQFADYSLFIRFEKEVHQTK